MDWRNVVAESSFAEPLRGSPSVGLWALESLSGKFGVASAMRINPIAFENVASDNGERHAETNQLPHAEDVPTLPTRLGFRVWAQQRFEGMILRRLFAQCLVAARRPDCCEKLFATPFF